MKKLLLILITFAAFTVSSAQAPLGMVLIPGTEKADPNEVITNHQELPVLLNEFYDAARFYQIDYGHQLENLKKVVLIDAPLSFLGDVSNDQSTILLNAELENYPNLMRVVLLRQFGKLYGLKKEQGGAIMSKNWEINQKYEDIAINTRARPHQKKQFFEALHKKKGLKKKL